MKKIIFFLLIPLISFGQIKVRDLPTTTGGVGGDWLIKNDQAASPSGTKKISVDDFKATYFSTLPTHTLSATSPISYSLGIISISPTPTFTGVTTTSLTIGGSTYTILPVASIYAGNNISVSNTTNSYTVATSSTPTFTSVYTNSLTVTATPVNGTDAANKDYVDDAIAIPLAKVIYVDSDHPNAADNGDSGRGNLGKPYATVEYVLANVVNTGTLSATTTNGSTTISATTNSLIAVGQYLTGTGIPFGSVITAFTSSTIVVSQACTASGSITSTWYQPYELRLNGDFTATSNWFKEAFYITGGSNVDVVIGNFILYNLAATALATPYYSDGSINYHLNHANAQLIKSTNVQTTSTTFKFKFGRAYGISTQKFIEFNTTTGGHYGNYNLEWDFINASAGYVFDNYPSSGSQNNFGKWQIKGDGYGLLGGIKFGNSGVITSNIESPNGILAMSVNSTRGVIINGSIRGNATFSGWCTVNSSVETASTVTFDAGYHTINGIINTSVLTITGASSNGMPTVGCTFNNYVTIGSSSTFNGTVIFNNYFNSTSGTVTINEGETTFKYGRIAGTLSVGANGVCNVAGGSYTDLNTVSVSGVLNILASHRINATELINYEFATTTINSGGVMNIEGDYGCDPCNNSGTLRINNGAYVKLRNAGNGETFYGLQLNAGSKTFIAGVVDAAGLITNTTTPTIRKVGGLLELDGARIKVGNGKSPIYCTLNTSDSKDIYNFGTRTNCDGSTYGLLINWGGSSFITNDLVGGTLYENTTYSFK